MGTCHPDAKQNNRPHRKAAEVLDPETELWLIREYQADPRSEAGREAAGRLLAAHHGLIVRWANLMCLGGHLAGFCLDDMIQEASLGFLEGVKYWRPGKGAKLTSYGKVCALQRIARWRDQKRNKPLPQEGEAKTPDDDDVEAPQPDRGTNEAGRQRLAEVLHAAGPLAAQIITIRHGLGRSDQKSKDVLTWRYVGQRVGLSAEVAEKVYADALAGLRANADLAA